VALAGADVIDVNIGQIHAGAEEAVVWMVDQIQAVAPDVQLSLDAHSAEVIMAGAESQAQTHGQCLLRTIGPADDVVGKLIPFAAEKGLELILPAMSSAGPPSIRRARGAGTGDGRSCLGPASRPRTSSWTRSSCTWAAATARTMPPPSCRHEAADHDLRPADQTIAGVEYLSQGAPAQLRSAINRVYLAMLSALGLSGAILDVMDSATMRDIRLIKGLRNESLYSVSDAELK